MEKTYNMWVGEKFREFREKNNLTQEQVGERLGITKKQVSNYESGRNSIRIETFYKLCNIYNIDSEQFVLEAIKFLKDGGEL